MLLAKSLYVCRSETKILDSQLFISTRRPPRLLAYLVSINTTNERTGPATMKKKYNTKFPMVRLSYRASTLPWLAAHSTMRFVVGTDQEDNADRRGSWQSSTGDTDLDMYVVN